MVDQNPAHHASGDPEKLRAVLPVYGLLVDEPEIRFVHESRGLQCVIGAFSIQILLRKAPQFVVNDGHQFVEFCFGVNHRIRGREGSKILSN